MLSENDEIIFDEKSSDDTMIKYSLNNINKLKVKSIQTEKEPLTNTTKAFLKFDGK